MQRESIATRLLPSRKRMAVYTLKKERNDTASSQLKLREDVHLKRGFYGLRNETQIRRKVAALSLAFDVGKAADENKTCKRATFSTLFLRGNRPLTNIVKVDVDEEKAKLKAKLEREAKEAALEGFMAKATVNDKSVLPPHPLKAKKMMHPLFNY